MSRTYEALTRAGSARGAGPDGPGLGRTAGPAIEWQVDPSRDVEYQRVRVWLTGAAARGHVIKTVLVAGCHSRTGATTIAYGASANLSSLARSASISAGGQTLNVTQMGTSCSYAVSPFSCVLRDR